MNTDAATYAAWGIDSWGILKNATFCAIYI
jgi:hypothetical protein